MQSQTVPAWVRKDRECSGLPWEQDWWKETQFQRKERKLVLPPAAASPELLKRGTNSLWLHVGLKFSGTEIPSPPPDTCEKLLQCFCHLRAHQAGNKQTLHLKSESKKFSPDQHKFHQQQILTLNHDSVSLFPSVSFQHEPKHQSSLSTAAKAGVTTLCGDTGVRTHKPLPFSHYSLNKLSANPGKTQPAPLPFSGTDNKKKKPLLIWKSWLQL